MGFVYPGLLDIDFIILQGHFMVTARDCFFGFGVRTELVWMHMRLEIIAFGTPEKNRVVILFKIVQKNKVYYICRVQCTLSNH